MLSRRDARNSRTSYSRLDFLPPRGCRDLAHTRESTLAVLLVRPLDVVHGVTNERPVRDDGRALGLAGVEHDARAFLLCSKPHHAQTLTVRPIEPSNLIALDRRHAFTHA